MSSWLFMAYGFWSSVWNLGGSGLDVLVAPCCPQRKITCARKREAAAERDNLKVLKTFNENGSNQGQKLALTVFFMPSSLDSGCSLSTTCIQQGRELNPKP